ncbi:MAG: hypothetical protein WED01_10035 [Candidatus Rokuibacteriota bacterium]
MIGAAALGIWIDVDPAALDDFNAWYHEQHIPERLGVPGFRRGRRYEATGNGPAYFTLYETQDAAVLSSAPYLARLNAPTEWTRRVLPAMTLMIRNAYRLVGASPDPAPPAPRLLTVRIQPHSGRGPYIRSWLATDALTTVAALNGVAGVAVYESDTSGTTVMTEERKLVGADVKPAPPFLALCELDATADPTSVQAFWHSWATKIAAEVTPTDYRLLYTRTSDA